MKESLEYHLVRNSPVLIQKDINRMAIEVVLVSIFCTRHLPPLQWPRMISDCHSTCFTRSDLYSWSKSTVDLDNKFEGLWLFFPVRFKMILRFHVLSTKIQCMVTWYLISIGNEGRYGSAWWSKNIAIIRYPWSQVVSRAFWRRQLVYGVQ